MDLLLAGPRKRVILPGWTLYGYGPSGAQAWYPVMVRGAVPGDPPVVGEVVWCDWDAPDTRRIVEVECGAGYVPAIVPIKTNLAEVEVSFSALAWEWIDQDHDWIHGRIRSGDWMTERLLRGDLVR